MLGTQVEKGRETGGVHIVSLPDRYWPLWTKWLQYLRDGTRDLLDDIINCGREREGLVRTDYWWFMLSTRSTVRGYETPGDSRQYWSGSD